MAQPQWITPAGSLGSIAEGEFYKTTIVAAADVGETVYYRLIAGTLPNGIQITPNGTLAGIPSTTANVQGVPLDVSRDVTSRFAIRAYTTNLDGTVARINDRTFEITVVDKNDPRFVTPAGSIATSYDGRAFSYQIEYTGLDIDENPKIEIFSGSLPLGLTIDSYGLISGVLEPLIGTPGTAVAGYDMSPFDRYEFDFPTISVSQNYEFTLKIGGTFTTANDPESIRTYSIYVESSNILAADTTEITADTTDVTADASSNRTPLILTPQGSIGTTRSDNFYAFRFNAVDFDGDVLEYEISVGPGIGFDSSAYGFDEVPFDRGTQSLPPGLVLNATTGWMTGYIPDQGATENTYQFALRVYKRDNPTIISEWYYYTLTITGDVNTQVTWLTLPDLGTILNGSISTLAVEAVNTGGRSLQYRLQSGSDSRLPQGLTLQPSGHITGRVSFNTYANDAGTTTYDSGATTFDSSYSFTVNAYAPQTQQVNYEVSEIIVIDGGSGYTGNVTVTISAPLATVGSIQATATAVVSGTGTIESITVNNAGSGYVEPPTVTITTDGGGSGAEAAAVITEKTINNAISVFRRFTVKVDRFFQTPYEKLYIKAMPPQEDRAILESLLQSQDIIPENLVYRADDPNFGVATSVVYDHAYGLNAAALEDYVDSLELNHYWKNLTLGDIRTARALDSSGNVLYEVVYSAVIDDLVNNEGVSVGKEVTLPYPINPGDSSEISVVYPNSLQNMRDQVVSVVGQISPPLTPALPLWMTSVQTDGRVLGFTPAWVIAYVLPGKSGQVAYNIRTQFGEQLNKIDFEVDRYELDRSQTHNWNTTTQSWTLPIAATTFDLNASYLYQDVYFSLGTPGYVSSVETYATDGSTTQWGFIASPSTAGIVVAIDGVVIPYWTPTTTGPAWVLSYSANRPNYNVTLWNNTQAYNIGAIVKNGNNFYRAVNQVPAGTATTELYYWLEIVEPNSVIVLNVASAGTFAGPAIGSGSSLTVNQIVDPEVLDPNSTATTATTFDGGSLTFVTVADRWTDTDAYDRYLLFPKVNIIDPTPTIPGPPPPPPDPVVTWRNSRLNPVTWNNDYGNAVVWLNNYA